ncbi:PAS fold [Phytophthora cactorum]|nr:PAS fold [Phytophthora cactorum]
MAVPLAPNIAQKATSIEIYSPQKRSDAGISLVPRTRHKGISFEKGDWQYGEAQEARPQRAAGPSPAPPLDNNVAETQQQDVVVANKQQKVASQSFGSQVEALAQLLLDANAPAVGVDVSGCVTRVLGRPISDFVYGAQRKSEIAAVVAACVADKRPVLELRVPLLTTTGRNAEVLTNMTPLLAEDGTCVGVYGVGQDVTEWAIQEKQYATVMMQANAPIIELDKEGNITVWNSKTESMTGYASVDMLGEPLLPVVDKSFRKIVSEKIEQALSGIPGADFELPLVTARGSRVEIVLCLTPRFDTLGSVMGVVAIGQDVTERNTKEMEYRKLIETANAPIFGVDTEGRVVIFNAKAAQISEYAPEEVMGVDLVDTLISEDFRSEVAAVFQRAFLGIETANFEFPLVTKTGRKVELLLNATPRYDHTGQLVGVVGIGQDITDRIIQEKEYSRLIDTANAPIFGVDCNCEVIIWNKKAAAITDYTNEDTIGQKIFKFISEDYRDVVGKVLSKAMEGEGTANFDFPLITKSGRRLDILLNATPKYDHFGNICGAVGIGQDITDRRAQEQEYTRLIDTANAPIFGVDENGCVNIWNRKAADTTQYSNEEVLGVNLVKNFIPDDFQEAVWAVLSQALEGQETANFEFPLITKDGRRVEILLNATPRYNEKGVVIGVVGIGQDITVRMAQEKETNRLIHSANAPIFGVDQDGRVNIWNLKVAEITQFSSQEIMGKDLVNRFVAEDHRESVGLLLRKALQGEQTGNFDFPLITKTGRRVEILLNATPRYDELGQIFDITERIAQEQEYIRLIDTANAPIFGVDSEGRVNIWNKKAAEIMQYTTDAVMGEKLVEKYITKDYQEAVSNVLSEALNGVETANFEFPLITKAGRRVEILLNATPRYNEHGAVIGMVGIGQDITDRIAQEQEYMRLIDTANAPIFGVDINGRVNIWNRKAAETTQYTNAEVLGKDLVAEFISEEYKVPVRSVLEKAFKDVETANFEFPLITKAGRRVEILLNATPRYNEQGEVMGMVGIGQDITVRMAQEKEKNRMIHSANAPIFGVDQDGLVNIWNLKVAEITQFSSEEVMGQDLVNNFVAEDHRDEVNFNLRKALDGKPTGNFDFPLITKTGRRVEILLNATPHITERIAQEQEYIRLIDTANAPIFGVDSEGRVNIWNKKAAEIMQYTTDAVMGEKLVEKYITKDYQEAVSNVLSEALNGVETANFEFPLITKAGRRVEILLNATPRYNEHGAVIGMVGIGQDITDRIAQEQEYTRLIDTQMLRSLAADIMQYTNEDVLGKDLVVEFISNEYKVPVRSVSRRLSKASKRQTSIPVITKAGRRVEILLNATPRYNERGEVMDITERIAQEEEYSRLIDTANAPIFGVDNNGRAADIMQYTNEDVWKAFEGVETANFEFPLITRAGRRVEILLNATRDTMSDITERIAQEQEHSRMIDTANAPIFGVDTDGRVNIWNRKAADIMQYTNEDVLGKNLVEQFISEEYRVAVRSVLEKAFEGVETANFEFPLITRAGRRVEILLNATPRYNERGEVMGMVGIGQDITERIAQEQEYSRLIDTANAPIFGAAHIMQYTNEDVLDKDLVAEFISEEYKVPVRSVLRRRSKVWNGKLRVSAYYEGRITERIAQEQEYTRLIDTANAPIFGVDINGHVNIWNRKAADIMQYTNEDVWFISEEYKVPVRSVLEKAFEVLRLRISNLIERYPRYNERGEVMGMVGIGQDITERIAQEEEYSRLIDTANAPIFGVDINGRVNIWNRKAAHIMQYTNEDVLGKDLVAEFISNEYKVPVRSVLEKAFEGIETANFEFPLITKAGRRVEILLNATPRYNERGEVMGMVGIGQDITERIAQEEEYSRLIDTANAPIFGVDNNGRVNIWNRKAADIMQYTNEDVLGKDLVAEFISEEYKVPVRSVLEKAFEGVETANFEFPLITRAGRRVEILLNATPRYNERGEVMGMVGIGQDITDRIAQEQEYTRLIDSANAPIFGVDVNGCVNIWNKKAAEITQYTPNDVMGENLVEKFITEDYRDAVGLVLSKALDGVETANFEFPLMTKAGRRVEILLNATSRFNEHGDVIGMVGIGQDITERIAQEQEYTRLIDTANAPIFGVDINGRVNIWNRKAAETTQYMNAEVLGKDLVAEFISKEYKVPVRSVLEKAFEGVETANFEFPLITKAGRRVEILLNATPRYNEHGEVMGMVGIGQDITERIAQEQEYTRLIDTANAPIFGVDINGHVNIWNRKAADIMQYTNEDVLGKDLVAEFISNEYKVPVRSVLEKAFEAGRRVEILLNATPRYNERGEVMGMVGIGQDITERIAQEQEYSRLIDTANARSSDVLGKDLVAEFISEEYKIPVRSVLEKAFEGVETANFEFPLITKAGRRVEILLNATPRYNEHGEVKGMVGIGQDITERIAQEQEYSRLIDTANAPIFGVDINGHVNIWNRKAAGIMQYTNEDVLGKDLVAEFISKEYKVPVRSVLEKAFEGVETANFEFPLITKAGRRVEILLNATPRYNERGEVMGMVGIGQDITERIAQEQEYSRLIDTANAPIFGVDINGHVNIWNRKAADIMQYTNEDVLGKDLVAEFISNEYKVPVRSVLEKAFEGVETANFEFPLITKAGRRVEILLNATPRYNERGEVMGMVGIGQDITERIAQEQEYSRLIDTANAPIFGVDTNMRINIFNRKAQQITNFSSEEVVGEMYVETIISQEFKAVTYDIMCKALQGNETASFELALTTKTGRKVNILLNATARFDQHGRIVGVVGIGQDITDRIAQEQEYTRLIDSANAPIFGVDVNGCVNIWNKKAAEITQYTPNDVMGENLVEKFITEDYREAVALVFSKASEGTETANFEFPLMTKAGRRVEILLNATSRFNEIGEVMGVVGIGQDITERIAQEQEYTRLIDTANAPIFGVDINGAETTQYMNAEVLGKDLVAEFISKEYKVPVRSVLEKAFEGVETANFEFPLITKAGRRVEILLNATPRYNEHGEVMGMVGIGQDITERIAQEQEYTRLIDTANAPIFGVDINGHVNIWNRKAADIMQYTKRTYWFISNEYKVPVRSVFEKAFEGMRPPTLSGRRVEILLNATPRTMSAAHIMQYTNEDVLGKDLVVEFISEEYKIPVRSVLEKAFEGVETANFEFPLITKAGRRVEILLNATPRYNEHGEVKGMVGIGQDITERIAQEQEYSRLIDTANAPIFGVDANMCVNIWNRKAAQITNYSIGEVMGENLVETFISPEFRPIVAEVLSQALTGVETANFEFPLITRPGTRIEILLNATPRYDLNGNIVGVVGIGQDITDRIAQEHEYFRLIDTANAPIFGIDNNGRINEWNQKIEEITGYHKSSVLGLSLVHTFVTPDCRQQVRQLLNQALIAPDDNKAGVFLLLLVNASSKKDMHGNIRGVIGVGQDYTARKHMEAAKVNFLASFSHELRTPLNGVLGMLELLKEQPLDKSIERYVHMAYVSGSLLLNLINDILDLSKIEAGHLEISTAPFQMHDLLDYSIEIFKFKARERELKLELKCGDNVPKAVIGDVVRLRQVLLNLLSNAIKFTNEGSITVACSVVHSPELPSQFKKLLFQVIDTGIGMDAEEKMRLFSLFTKLERTRQNNPTGSGLGLAICKQLAELMDGSIDVDSELGVGSNFFFTVVVRLIDEVDPKHAYYSSEDFLDPSTALLSPNGAIRAGENGENASVRAEVPKQARILVVEDNEFNWEVVKCFLQQDDHLLQWEVNGRDAVKAYSENHTEFDLVFMDCEMPIMDGYTATNTIREFELKHNLPRIPILGLTAYAMSGDRQKCLDCGMDEFMVKPISKLSLRKAIRQWMRIRYLGQHNAALGAVVQVPGVVGQPVTLRNGPRPTAKSPMRIPAPAPVSTARLAPASRHMQQLDLAQAISNLELDDPMSIGLQSGRAVRTATPTTSIFSLGPSVNNTSRQTSTNDLPDVLRLSRNTSGASSASPPEPENSTETSTTLPYVKTPFIGVTNCPAQQGARSPLTNPTLWSHPPFNTKDLPTERPQSWPGVVPKKKVSFHEELESSYPSRAGHSSIGSSMPSVLERMETGSSVEDDTPLATTTITLGESTISHSIDPMSIEIPEGDPVNYSLGVDQCGGHEELFLTLLEKFATTSEAIMTRVIEAHERNDFVIARREAHSLKGSSAYVAALRVSKCAFRVQVAYEHLMAQQATGEGSDTLAAKQIVDDSVQLLRKEQRLLRGYLRRNFEFKTKAGPSQVNSGQQPDSEDKPTGPCCVM